MSPCAPACVTGKAINKKKKKDFVQNFTSKTVEVQFYGYDYGRQSK